MATFVGHSLIALTVCAPLQRTSLGRAMSMSWWLAALMLVSLLPDLDVLMLRWLPYSHPFSHRGFSHSLFFAALAAMFITISCRLAGFVHGNLFTLILVWLILAAVMASHGLLDALTDGGLGIGLLSPFSASRYFFPVRPLPVAWLSPAVIFSPYMMHVYAVEAALFGPFCLAAWLTGADLSSAPLMSIFRWLAAAAFFIFGLGAWIVRCQSL